MKLNNITLREYSKSKSVVNYDALLTSLKPDNSFAGNKFELNKMSYNAVKKIEKKLREGKTFEDLSTAFQLAFKVTAEQFYKTRIVEFYGAKNFLKEEFRKLLEQERTLLKTDGVNADLWEQAGGKSLEPFGVMMPLVKIGKIYGMYPLDVGLKPYNEIIMLLVLHKRSDAVETRLNELTRPKQK